MQQSLLVIPSFFGISIEVYVIILLLVVPIFFVWRKLLKRFIKSVNTLVITSLLATVITAPIVYVGAALAFFAVLLHYPKRDFDRQGWLANKEKRYEFSTDIIQSGMLLGKSRNEVKMLLGDEGQLEDNHWEYYLGLLPSIGGIDPDVLDVYFENDKVVKVGQHET